MTQENIQALFSRAADEFSELIAAQRGPQVVTYRELDERSNSLANFLLDAGTANQPVVAILAEDGLEIINAILGILKARGVFVPLDSGIPENRLRAMIAEVRPTWFVVEAHLIEKLSHIVADTTVNAKVIRFGDGAAASPCCDQLTFVADYAELTDTRRPVVPTQPDDMCYVYFTSGSTGRPKGIAGRLKGIDHFIRWELKTLGLGEGIRVSQLMSPSFDGYLRDLFVPLIAGGTICVPPTKETILDARKLVAWINEQEINLIHCIPSLFRAMVNEELRPSYFASLRYIVMAGEPLLPVDVRKWVEVFADRVQLVNLYGTSETTMAKLAYFVQPSDIDRPSMPVGKPIEGARVIVVDSAGKPCRPGKVGEIYIRTPYRSLGYFNQPELTDEVFIKNPFSDQPDDIVYKTGDLGRMLPDGNYEYLGRRDLQVKVRGVRIELKEVENVLRSHPAVKDVAVTDHAESNGETYLCAYVVLSEELASSDLRDFMRQDLPEPMVPSFFVNLPALPRTFSGKVDRRALPRPERKRDAMKAPFVAPRTPTEEIVAGIWTQVLDIKEVGIHDNFFELGGHSLRMTQVVSRLSKAFQIELPLRTLFEIPTISALANRIEAIQRTAENQQLPPLVPISRNGHLQLSFAQQRLWFLDQLAPGTTAYNLPMAAQLRGQLNVAVLQRSLNSIVQRHEALRTSFGVVDGQPAQIIAPELTIKLRLVDLRELPAEERELESRHVAKIDGQVPFDLTRAPLVRVCLLLMAEQDHVLILNQHHIISDTWSSGVLLQELAVLYAAYEAGQASPLEELPVQYADFAQWQRNWLQGDELARQLSYWQQQLAAAPDQLSLPTDRPRPPYQTFSGRRHMFLLPGSLSEALAALSHQEGVTMFMTLLTAFQLLLARHSGQNDICVGTPIAGRNRLEIESLIGFFVNTLILRTDLSGNPTFRELLGRVREVCLGAYAHQDLPIEKLVEYLQPERSLNRTPMFQVMFIFQNAPMPVSGIGGLTANTLEQEERNVTLDLVLCLTDTPRGLGGLLDYNTDLFDGRTMLSLMEHFRVLLEGIVAAPEQRIADLPLLAETEERQLLVEWNRTEENYSSEVCLHEMFEAQVERTPDALAVVYEDQQLSYRELNEQSNQLAQHLRALGVKPETTVGLCLGRSVEMLIGMLGILKAGGNYVPLDPEAPKERLAFMLDAAQIDLVLTLVRDAKALTGSRAQLVCLDTEWAQPEQLSVKNFRIDACNLAYVIYTSGSTGQPKGVMVSHRAICNTLQWRRQTFSLSEKDRILQNIPFTFDPSIWQIFGALISGATLVLLPPARHQESAYLVKLMAEREITITDFPPSMLRVILEERELGQCRALRHLFCGGEVLPTDLQERFFARLNANLYNQYGPTEAAIDTTFWQCERTPTHISTPIGRPIANKEIYLLDPHLRPGPIGVVGQLHIGGIGLARGYLNSPDLTAERFIPNSFSATAGERLYQTGDLARYLPDGNLEFAGRLDSQVKIRGNRVELGEIEVALNQLPAVRESAVVLREEREGEKRLVAYVVLRDEAVPSGELRKDLREKVPAYMMPSVFVSLDTLPRMPSGKVDRQALPAPVQARPDSAGEMVTPRTPVEEVVCEIWADVLDVAAVGTNDNFFELGGHSLLATQVIARVRQAFKVELPLRRMFEAANAAELAGEIQGLLRESFGVEATPLAPVSRDQSLPLSFAQQRLWFLEQLHPDSAAYHIPLAIRLKGRLDVPAIECALNEIIRRHEVFRTALITQDGEPLQVIQPTLTLAPPHIDLSALAAQTREDVARQLVNEESRKPFDLAQAPLLRTLILRLAEEEHVVLLTLHHLISDGWSIGILTKEVATLYEVFSSGKPSPLAELRIQYADFAQWQWRRLQGKHLSADLDYWARQLASPLPVLALPTDRRRPALQSFTGSHETLVLSEELKGELKVLSRREGVTLFMTLLGAFTTLLSRYAGQTDILVGTPVTNRSHSEVEGLIGLFVNTLVLRTDLAGDPSFSDLLKRVREVAVGAYAHQDLPFEKLVKELQPDRDLSRSPMFQVMFNMQNTEATALEFKGLQPSPLITDAETAQFDLTLTVVETGKTLTCSLGYNIDLFEAPTISRMLAHFQRLLHGIVSNPTQCLSALPLVTVAERQQLLSDWNDTDAEYAWQRMHDGFEAQAALTPEAVALVYQDQEISYRELNERANQLAWHLRDCGIGPETLVGICLERSPLMVTGLLAILKAGGAYVPLDPAYPVERLTWMIEDARVQLLLTEEGTRARVSASAANLICLDTESAKISQHSRKNLPPCCEGENTAYAIYTSGSTGQPKGILLRHRAVANFLQSVRQQPGLTERDRLLAVTTLSFDIAVLELFLPISVGARVVLAQREEAADATQLIKLLEQHKITVMQATPATWHLLIAAGWRNQQHLKVLCGGEALTWELAQQLLGCSDEVWNMYGPTETTIWSASRQLRSADQQVLIGCPLANTQLYILDEQLQPVPVGVTGELYIGGDGLAGGYLKQPALTAGKFIPDPFSATAGQRLYRTGDMVRWRGDGDFEFIGRGDEQVKIRGYRIELAEIQSVLLQHPQVSAAVVMVQVDAADEKRLVAYVVSADEQHVSSGELRQFLQGKLPSYMLPSAFVQLSALPLTANGKLNRRALPAPEGTRDELPGAYVAPRDQIELQLAHIWEEILEVRPIGITDNFFDLGGHSFLALRLTSRLQKQFGRELPLASLFQGGTIQDLASILRRQDDRRAGTPLVALQPAGTQRPFFCVHEVTGSVLGYVRLAQHLGSDQPVYAFQMQDLNGERSTYTDLSEIAAGYVKMMRQVQAKGPYRLGGWSYGGIVAFEMAQQLQRQGEEVDLLALLDTTVPSGADQAEQLDDAAILAGLARVHNLEVSVEELRRMEPAEQLSYVLERARQVNALTADVAIPQLRRILEISKLNLLASARYVPQPYPKRITLFRSAELRPEDVGKKEFEIYNDPALGWGAFAVEPVEIHVIPGDHFTLLGEPNVRVLSERLKVCLEGTQTARSAR